MSEYSYDFSLPDTPFLRCKSKGENIVINKNNIISIREIGYHQEKTGDFVEILIDCKSTYPTTLVLEGKIDDLKGYFEPFYL